MTNNEAKAALLEECPAVYAGMDILPFIPLCGGLGVKEYGTYTVMRGLKTLGRVTYSGRPTQDKPETAILGINNDGNPREECYCKHPEAEKTFRRICPRSPRAPGFIGFTKIGGDKPQIKTAPRWCPLREV